MIGAVFRYIIETVTDIGYWIVSIICVCSIILYAGTHSQRFLTLAYGSIILYILLLGIGSGMK